MNTHPLPFIQLRKITDESNSDVGDDEFQTLRLNRLAILARP